MSRINGGGRTTLPQTAISSPVTVTALSAILADIKDRREAAYEEAVASLFGVTEGAGGIVVTCNKMTWAEIVALYRLTMNAPPHNMPPRYNICPTDPIDVVRETDGRRELAQSARPSS